jgi:hypothetical protein
VYTGKKGRRALTYTGKSADPVTRLLLGKPIFIEPLTMLASCIDQGGVANEKPIMCRLLVVPSKYMTYKITITMIWCVRSNSDADRTVMGSASKIIWLLKRAELSEISAVR